mgnify:CR=1 FL=1
MASTVSAISETATIEPRAAIAVDLDCHKGKPLRFVATHLGLRPAERKGNGAGDRVGVARNGAIAQEISALCQVLGQLAGRGIDG